MPADGDRLHGWPTGMRILAPAGRDRRRPASVAVRAVNGFRYQVNATAARGGEPQRLEARHQVHARIEGIIRCGKDTGLVKCPSHRLDHRRHRHRPAVLDAAAAARRPARQGRAPATLPYRLLHTATRLIRHVPADLPHTPNLALDARIRPARSTASAQPLIRLTDPRKGVTSPGRRNTALPHDTRRPHLPSHRNQNPSRWIDAHRG
jgi:hypothetical protein